LIYIIKTDLSTGTNSYPQGGKNDIHS